MSTMNQLLAEYYNTNGTKTAAANREDIEKAAQYELFTKIAAENKIDLSKLNDEQTRELFVETFKTAGEMPPQFAAHAKGKEEGGKKDEHEELEEKAKKEHEEKKAMATKLAEADFMGRAMAHAFVNEAEQIAASREKNAGQATGEWQVTLPEVASAVDKLAMHRAFAIVQGHNAQVAEHNKTAAADKQVAFIDEKDAATKIAQVHTKGLGESIKVASAPDHKVAVEVRALETLEAAGFPVDWGK
jgi:hypothetical protein